MADPIDRPLAHSAGIRAVARLARLELTDDELEVLETQLAEILRYMEQLEAVDIEGVEPTVFAGPAGACRRPGLRLEIPAGAHLETAPDSAGGAFRVPKVI